MSTPAPAKISAFSENIQLKISGISIYASYPPCRQMEHEFVLLLCKLWPGHTMPSLDDVSDHMYNPMAALSLVPWSSTAKNLISRGMPHVFSLEVPTACRESETTFLSR